MGDHRSDSSDSRFHDAQRHGQRRVGADESLIVGRAVALVWPLDHLTWLSNPRSTFAKVPSRRPSAGQRARLRPMAAARTPQSQAEPAGRARPAARRPPRARRHGRGRPRARSPGRSRVGVVVIDETCRSAPTGRQGLQAADPARPRGGWCRASSAGPGARRRPRRARRDRRDRHHRRAAAGRPARPRRPSGVVPDLVILDGNHDWLTRARRGRPASPSPSDAGPATPAGHHHDQGRPQVLVGGRRERAGQGGARRDDGRPRAASHPAYGWELNKGYAAPEHMDALRAPRAVRAAPPLVAAARRVRRAGRSRC